MIYNVRFYDEKSDRVRTKITEIKLTSPLGQEELKKIIEAKLKEKKKEDTINDTLYEKVLYELEDEGKVDLEIKDIEIRI